MKVQNVAESESRRTLFEAFFGKFLKLLPMSFFHKLAVERTDKGQNSGHVFDFFRNHRVTFVGFDFSRKILQLKL